MVHGGVPAGGSLALAGLIEEHGAALEADFQRFYGLDLATFIRGENKPRRALRLAGMLPPESAYMAQVTAGVRRTSSSRRVRPEHRWRQIYGAGVTAHAVWDLWDQQAALNTDKGQTAKQHPRGGK